MDSAIIIFEKTAPARTLLEDVHAVLVGCQYPLGSLLEDPIPSYRQPFTSPSTLRSTALLLSFPPEVLQLIFIHGASTLIPKPGASSRDSIVLDRHRKKYLCSLSLVTTSWSVEAQLEMLYYTLCQSADDLHSLVTVLENTGRIKHLKRLSLTSEVNVEAVGSFFRPPIITSSAVAPSESSKLTIHLVKRLVQLGPVLEELEVIGGDGDNFYNFRMLLEDLQPGRTTEGRTPNVHKISERTNLCTLYTAMKCSTLMLNRMMLFLDRTELVDTLGKISEITSLVVMKSSYYDLVTPPRQLYGDPGFILSPFLHLTTLSLDKSKLSMHLLRSNQFPAVTTFELIPDLLIDSQALTSEWILTALLKFPSLKRIILPTDFWLYNAEVLFESFGHTQVGLAVENQWNWLELPGGQGSDTDDEESDGDPEEGSAYYAKYDEGWY